MAGSGEGDEAGVGEEAEAGTLQGHEVRTVGGRADQRLHQSQLSIVEVSQSQLQ